MGHTGLLLVDIQQALQGSAFYGTERNNPDAEANAGRVLQFFRDQSWPVFHVKHNSTNPASPLAPGKAGNAIHPLVSPRVGEPLFEKTVNSGFIGTELEFALRAAGVTDLVIAGLTTEHCVSTTVRMAANLGFKVSVVSDATAAFDKTSADGKHYPASLIHEISLETLRGEFAEIQDTQELLRYLTS